MAFADFRPDKLMIREIIRLIEAAFTRLGLIGLFLMMVLVTANAIGRYGFNRPIRGVYETTEMYLMLMVIFLVAASLQRKEGNIRVDILSRRLPETAETVIALLGRLMAFGTFCAIAVGAAQRTYEAYVHSWSTVIAGVPFVEYLSWGIMAVGLALFLVRVLVQIKDDIWTLIA